LLTSCSPLLLFVFSNYDVATRKIKLLSTIQAGTGETGPSLIVALVDSSKEEQRKVKFPLPKSMGGDDIEQQFFKNEPKENLILITFHMLGAASPKRLPLLLVSLAAAVSSF
jgi:hypothetical protein